MPKDGEKESCEPKYPNIVSGVYGAVWAIMPEKLEAILDFVDLKAAGLSISVEDIEAKRAVPREGTRTNSIAILPLFGVISHRMNMLGAISGGTSTEAFGNALDEAIADESVASIVIDVDSPGGSVYGIHELSQKIYSARSKKRIVAAVNSLCASAAYWIASAAHKIYITPSGEAGSVGVIAVHRDFSEAEQKAGIKTTFITAGKYKAEGNESEPLADDAKTEMQGRVDEYYKMMVDGIARNRGFAAGKITSDFGQGRVFGARRAKSTGMVDAIASFEQVMRHERPQARKGMAAMHEQIQNIKAEANGSGIDSKHSSNTEANAGDNDVAGPAQSKRKANMGDGKG